MQRVLSNEEILREIFTHLASEWPDIRHPSIAQYCPPSLKAQAPLRDVALVCKAFSEPALDILWRTPPSVVRLFRILSGFHEVPAREAGAKARFHLRGPVSDEEWSTFKKYARRVRVMSWKGLRIDPWILSYLSRRGKSPLFPGLRKLQFRVDLTVGAGVLALVAPGLRTLSIVNTTSSHVLNNGDSMMLVLDEIVEKAPHLREIHIQAVPGLNMWPLSKLPHLQRFTTQHELLRDLRPAQMQEPTLAILSRCTDLTHLVCRPSLPAWPVHFEGFESLTDLKLYGTVTDIRRLLAAVKSEHMSSLDFVVNKGDASDLTALVRSLSRFNSAALSTLRVMFTEVSTSRNPKEVSAMTWMSPLLTLSALRDIAISFEARSCDLAQPTFPPRMCLSTQDVRRIAEAFPLLEQLALVFEPHERQCPDVWALESFARECPSLWNLRLPLMLVNPQDPKWQLKAKDFPVYSHGLRDIRIGYDVCSNDRHIVRLAAAYIDSLFPNLDVAGLLKLYPDHVSPRHRDAVWYDILLQMDTLQTARRQQKIRDGVLAPKETLDHPSSEEVDAVLDA